MNSNSSSFIVRDSTSGGVEIVGSISDLKGVGTNTAKAIARRAPFKSLVDFYERTAGDGVRVTVKTFEILARATAFRDIFPDSKTLLRDARPIWEGLKRGEEPKGNSKGFSDSEIVAVVSEVWPLFVGQGGRSLGDEALGKIKGLVENRRMVVSPGEALDDGFAIMFGRLSKFRQFPNDKGGKRGLALLSGARGGEQSITVDDDVMSVSADALSTTDKFVVAAVLCNAERQSARAERVWTFEEALALDSPELSFLLSPSKTRPKDAGRTMSKAAPNSTFQVEGVVLRVRRHLDKSGRDMLSLGLMSETGFLRVFVFAQRATKRDIKKIKAGVPVSFRARKMESGTACHLTDGKISFGVSKSTKLTT